MATPYIVGVTGSIATGKSAVMDMLGDLGADVIDADLVYRELIRPGMPLWERLRRKFGDGIVGDDGQIDRRALGAIVFGSSDKLAVLDDLTHPAVVAEIRSRVDASGAAVVAVEAVKLIESGMGSLCGEVWLVVADQAGQLGRLVARNGISLDDAERRLVAQPDEASRRLAADHVIDNSGSLTDLRACVEERWRSLPKQALHDTDAPILPK